MSHSTTEIAQEIITAAADAERFVVALAGPPGAGKSTLAEYLWQAIDVELPGEVVVVPMDGYHFDNAVLGAELIPHKGAPHTFDVDGLHADLLRIRRADAAVAVPVFDRPLDLARAGGRIVSLAHRIILVEGNYLLLDQSPWRDLAPLFDFSVMLEVDEAELERRLIERWQEMGLAPAAATDKARNKDMLNARLVKRHSRTADLVWC
ncbi:nucleoside/nucleotide kinase family protein [Halomonas sp. ML-15]|uniref:nucleoside/nucleotide kinase family protein n=1 Tax=Halomonas sp. ML-15 TaxID=2773305 RepID=UPI0017474180|nr:nucleoside/nucleotide kinase family protein [Halomonas sp. ML-15]MBD3898221.1 nucleoside/nucleotide kinase family protein [Halomonas sp. ML-15]